MHEEEERTSKQGNAAMKVSSPRFASFSNSRMGTRQREVGEWVGEVEVKGEGEVRVKGEGKAKVREKGEVKVK